MKKLIAMLVVLTFAGSGFAANLDEGTNELRLDGSLDFDTAADTEIDLALGWGVFVQDNMEVGVEASIYDNDNVTIWDVGAFGEINFPSDSTLVPFVGAGVSYGQTDFDQGSDEDAVIGTAYAGLKYFLTEDLAIAGQGRFQYASEDIYPEDDGDVSDTNWDLTVGLRYFFDM